MHCGFVADKVVWHSLDGRFNSLQIGAFFRYHKAFPQVHLITGGIRSLTAADGFQIFFLGNGILLAIFYAGDAADGIGVALAYALAPEGVALSLRQHAVAQYPQKGEQARIPAYGDDGGSVICFRYRVHVCEMLRNAGMSIETVNRDKVLRQFRSLVDQVRGGTAAQYHNVDFILIFQYVF